MGTITLAAGERPRPEWIRTHPRAWVAAVSTVCFGAFMGQLDASVVAVAYRPIGETFHVGLASVQIVSLTYLIALGALLVPVGKVSDRLGRKRVYLYGFTLFTVASVGCAVAPSLAVLALVRAAQGAGAAMLQANSVALVSTSAPSGRLRTALGIHPDSCAVGLALAGLGLGLFVPTNNAAVMTAVPARSAALGGGLVSTARAIGTAAGTALVAIALAREVSGRAALIALVAVTIAAAATLPAHSARPGQHSRA